jgi:hypothetical protein
MPPMCRVAPGMFVIWLTHRRAHAAVRTPRTRQRTVASETPANEGWGSKRRSRDEYRSPTARFEDVWPPMMVRAVEVPTTTRLQSLSQRCGRKSPFQAYRNRASIPRLGAKGPERKKRAARASILVGLFFSGRIILSERCHVDAEI